MGRSRASDSASSRIISLSSVCCGWDIRFTGSWEAQNGRGHSTDSVRGVYTAAAEQGQNSFALTMARSRPPRAPLPPRRRCGYRVSRWAYKAAPGPPVLPPRKQWPSDKPSSSCSAETRGDLKTTPAQESLSTFWWWVVYGLWNWETLQYSLFIFIQ